MKDVIDNILEGVGELNLGRSETIVTGPSGQAGPEVRLLQIPALTSKRAQIITVHFTVKTEAINANPGGPGVGIIEFSSGGAALQRIEFDLPSPRPFGPNWAAAGPSLMARRELSNGLSVSVPAAGLLAYARLDGSLRPLNDNTTIIGGGSLVASAFVGRFPLGRARSNLKKTVYAVISGGGSNPLAPTDAPVNIGIPNYAVRVRFPRIPMSVPLSITIAGVNGAHSVYSIPTLSDNNLADGLPIELMPTDFSMLINNVGADNITNLQAVFDLEI